MSKIATVTSVANAQNLRVEYNVGSLDLNLQIDKPTNFADANAFLARLATLEIEVNKQTRTGMVNVLNRGKVLHYAEMAQANRGIMILDASNLASIKLQTAIELSDYGAIPIQDGEFFEVNFFNVPVNAGETVNFEVYALDFEQLSSYHNIYEKHYFNAGAPREIDVRSAKTIAIPTADVDKIELLYHSGRRVLYTKPELQAIQRDGLEVRNYIKTSTTVKINEMGDLILHNIASAVTAKITTLNNTNVLILKHQAL